jgi:hypothetical protein
MNKKMFMCCLVLVMLTMLCFSAEKALAIEPNGVFSIEKTLWGYEGEEDLALGFCGGTIYLVSLGTLPRIAVIQNAAYFSLFFISFFNAQITLEGQEDQINGMLFPFFGFGFHSFSDRAEEGTRALRMIDDCWSPAAFGLSSFSDGSGEDTGAMDVIDACWSAS